MKNNYVRALPYFLVSLFFAFLNYLFVSYILELEGDFMPIYFFTTVLCLVTLLMIAETDNLFHKWLGFIFIGIILLKLVAAKVFMNLYEEIDLPRYKYTFVFLYLINIALVTIYTARLLLNPKDDKKQS